MTTINDTEIENQVSDNEKINPENDFTKIKKQQNNNRKPLIFSIISAVCLLLCITFFVLFLLTTNNTRTVFFKNNRNYLKAKYEIGSLEKRETIDSGITYHHRINEDDDIVLEVYVNTSHRFTYYLSNAEMAIGFYKGGIMYVPYKMTKNGLEISDNSYVTKEYHETAEIFRKALDAIIDSDLDGSCTMNDILIEYYNYCNSVKAIKISGIVFSVLFLVGFIVCLIFTIKLQKSKKHNNQCTAESVTEQQV